MADEKTTVSEVVTGLALSGASSVDAAIAARPTCLRGVDAAAWMQLTRARLDGRHTRLFEVAWANGLAFLAADDGLRGRRPLAVEWKGPHKPPGYDSLPADLRVDHVYLVSCKYGSDISGNSSPSNLFDRLLADRARGSEPWYTMVARAPYEAFYAGCAPSSPACLPTSPPSNPATSRSSPTTWPQQRQLAGGTTWTARRSEN